MGREDDVRVRSADPIGEKRNESRMVVPAFDERELRAARQSLLQLLPVARDRAARVVRGEDEPDDELRSRGDRLLSRRGDTRRPVLHPREHRGAERGLERGARLLGDRVQRVLVLDAEPAIAVGQLVEPIGS